MKRKFTKLSGALLALLMVPSVAQAQATTLASWTFDTGYDVSSNVYTPNESLAPGDKNAAAIWTWNQQILPNTYVGTQTDYYVSGKTARYWYLKQHWYNDESNYGPYMFQVVNDTETNSITDYTDASQHNNYIEIAFTTTNYKNINLSYKLNNAKNTDVAPTCTVVASTDGGTTWSELGTVTTTTAWYTYVNDSKDILGAANKDIVIVRIIVGNGINAWLTIDDIVVTGEYATVFTPEYTLTTSASPSTAGSISRSPNAVSYEENTAVSLTATPNVGYAFVEWQDGLGNQLSTANPYNVTMTENKTIVAVYEIAPIAAGTTITAASWTFNSGYDISGLVYTPNTDEWAAIAQVQAKNNQVKVFNANNGYTALTNYEATISNDNTGHTYYSIKDNNGDKIFSLYPSGISNSVTDYTNAAEHLVYYQFSFPTTGLKDVSITFNFTYSGNAVRNLELVYSTDGGTTWTDDGACAGGANWYTYAETTKSINADNKSSVIVRLLPANGEDGDYRMNNFTVKGTIATDAVTISDKLYATYYNSIPVQLPANVQAATIDGETSGTLTLNWRYAAGDVIPGGTPVLLKATAADDYDLTYVANDPTAAPAGNYLYGSDVAVTTTGGGTGAKYYALQDGTNGLGFYWMAAEGAAFTSGAHKAWLALPAATPAPFFSLFNDMQTTGIYDVRSKMADIRGDFFDLQGRKVANPTKGLYIVNGKKVAIK